MPTKIIEDNSNDDDISNGINYIIAVAIVMFAIIAIASAVAQYTQ